MRNNSYHSLLGVSQGVKYLHSYLTSQTLGSLYHFLYLVDKESGIQRAEATQSVVQGSETAGLRFKTRLV